MPWDIWLIFVVLAVVLPWRGRWRMRKLLAMEHVSRTDRLVLYASTVVFQWVAATIVAWRAWANGFTLHELGLVTRDSLRVASAALIGAALIGSLQWMNLRRVGRLPVASRGFLQAVAERIFPQTGIERIPFFALAITAGLCEEFLYRGFAMAALRRAGLAAWTVIAVSSILFGLAHLYQGRGGLVSTLLVGAVFGSARIAYDTLIPVILWHATLDAVAGIAGPRYLGRNAAHMGGRVL
jgi:membrane protease YdiL (CAAX protease family)